MTQIAQPMPSADPYDELNLAYSYAFGLLAQAVRFHLQGITDHTGLAKMLAAAEARVEQAHSELSYADNIRAGLPELDELRAAVERFQWLDAGVLRDAIGTILIRSAEDVANGDVGCPADEICELTNYWIDNPSAFAPGGAW